MPDIDDDQLDVLLTQIHAYRASGNFSKMLQASQKLMEKAPDFYAGYQNAGQALLALKKYDESIKLLNEALALRPESDFVHYLLASVHRVRKQYKQAQKHMRKAIELAPESAAYWVEYGQLYLDAKDRVGASRCAHKALKLEPGNADALHLLALNTPKSEEKGVGQALEKYFVALEANPEDPYIHNNIGVCYMQQGKLEKAEKFFRQALAMHPTEDVFRNNLYLVFKRRSIMYKILCAPAGLFVLGIKYRWPVILVFALPWLLIRPSGDGLLGSPFLPLMVCILGLLVWALTFLPLIAFYQYLTMKEIRRMAGEIGADGGGRIQRWPFAVRYGLFVVALAAVWTGLIALVSSEQVRKTVMQYGEDAILVVSVCVILGALLFSGRKKRQIAPLPPDRPNRKPKGTIRGRKDIPDA